MKQRDLTKGSITGNLMLFALPLMAGNLLQQCYNIADTLIVGRYLGEPMPLPQLARLIP